MAFQIVVANEIAWVSKVNSNFAEAYSWDSLTVRSNYVPSVALALLTDIPVDAIAITDVSGNVVPSVSGYSDLIATTDTLTGNLGTVQSMDNTAHTTSALNDTRTTAGKVRTVSARVVVPDGGAVTIIRFSTDYLASIKVEDPLPINAAILMATTVGPNIAAITAGANVVVSSTGGTAPATKIQYSPHPEGLEVSNNTGAEVIVVLYISYSSASDITLSPPMEKSGVALLYTETNSSDFITRSNVDIGEDGLLVAVGTPIHTATTATINYTNPILNMLDNRMVLEIKNLSISTVADTLRSNVEIIDGDALVIVTADTVQHEVVASGVTTEAGPVYVMDTSATTLGEIPNRVYSVGGGIDYIFGGSSHIPAVTTNTYEPLATGAELFLSDVSPRGYVSAADTCTLIAHSSTRTHNWVDVTGMRELVITHTGNRTEWHYMNSVGDCLYGGNFGNVSLNNKSIFLPEDAVFFRMYYAYYIETAVISVKEEGPLVCIRTFDDIVATNFTALQVQVDFRAKDTKMVEFSSALWEF